MRTIDWDGSGIVIVDQTLLPAQERMLTLASIAELIEAIQSLRVRGAMALGVAGAMGVALAARLAQRAGRDVEAATRAAAEQIRHARPTAVNLSWGVDQALAALPHGVAAVQTAALAVRDRDIAANRAIGVRGADLLAPLGPQRVLTHCNAGALAGVEDGTALAVITELHRRGLVREVLVAETRPLLQGSRLTAWELRRSGIPYRVIVDGAGAGLLLRGYAASVVVGADRIAANGDVANKVGTVAHALAAHRASAPFVVAAPEATIDPLVPDGAAIPIEERDGAEVLSVGASFVSTPGSTALNPAFDVTPAAIITAIVTEDRVLRPSTVDSIVRI